MLGRQSVDKTTDICISKTSNATWRSSTGGSLVSVLYKATGSHRSSENIRVKMLHNERISRLPTFPLHCTNQPSNHQGYASFSVLEIPRCRIGVEHCQVPFADKHRTGLPSEHTTRLGRKFVGGDNGAHKRTDSRRPKPRDRNFTTYSKMKPKIKTYQPPYRNQLLPSQKTSDCTCSTTFKHGIEDHRDAKETIQIQNWLHILKAQSSTPLSVSPDDSQSEKEFEAYSQDEFPIGAIVYGLAFPKTDFCISRCENSCARNPTVPEEHKRESSDQRSFPVGCTTRRNDDGTHDRLLVSRKYAELLESVQRLGISRSNVALMKGICELLAKTFHMTEPNKRKTSTTTSMNLTSFPCSSGLTEPIIRSRKYDNCSEVMTPEPDTESELTCTKDLESSLVQSDNMQNRPVYAPLGINSGEISNQSPIELCKGDKPQRQSFYSKEERGRFRNQILYSLGGREDPKMNLQMNCDQKVSSLKLEKQHSLIPFYLGEEKFGEVEIPDKKLTQPEQDAKENIITEKRPPIQLCKVSKENPVPSQKLGREVSKSSPAMFKLLETVHVVKSPAKFEHLKTVPEMKPPQRQSALSSRPKCHADAAEVSETPNPAIKHIACKPDPNFALLTPTATMVKSPKSFSNDETNVAQHDDLTACLPNEVTKSFHEFLGRQLASSGIGTVMGKEISLHVDSTGVLELKSLQGDSLDEYAKSDVNNMTRNRRICQSWLNGQLSQKSGLLSAPLTVDAPNPQTKKSAFSERMNITDARTSYEEILESDSWSIQKAPSIATHPLPSFQGMIPHVLQEPMQRNRYFSPPVSRQTPIRHLLGTARNCLPSIRNFPSSIPDQISTGAAARRMIVPSPFVQTFPPLVGASREVRRLMDYRNGLSKLNSPLAATIPSGQYASSQIQGIAEKDTFRKPFVPATRNKCMAFPQGQRIPISDNVPLKKKFGRTSQPNGNREKPQISPIFPMQSWRHLAPSSNLRSFGHQNTPQCVWASLHSRQDNSSSFKTFVPHLKPVMENADQRMRTGRDEAVNGGVAFGRTPQRIPPPYVSPYLSTMKSPCETYSRARAGMRFIDGSTPTKPGAPCWAQQHHRQVSLERRGKQTDSRFASK